MRPSWFKISAILAGLWLVVGGVMWWLEERRPSIEKVLAFAAAHGAEGKTAEIRLANAQAVAAQYLRLDFDDRRTVLVSPELKSWWTALSPEERRTFRLGIFPQGRRMVEFYDQIPPARRPHEMARILQETKKSGGGAFLDNVPPAIRSVIETVGLKRFYESTYLDMNVDTLLYFHEMEKRFVWSRR